MESKESSNGNLISEDADIKNVMRRYRETTEQQKAVGAWLTMRNTDSRLMKSNIATHSMRLAMSRKVGMTGRLIGGEAG